MSDKSNPEKQNPILDAIAALKQREHQIEYGGNTRLRAALEKAGRVRFIEPHYKARLQNAKSPDEIGRILHEWVETYPQEASESECFKTALLLRPHLSSAPEDPQEVKIPELHTMQNLEWSEVNIAFSNHSIQIKVRGYLKRFHFATLGFRDDRKGDQPNSEWILLAYFAHDKGIIRHCNQLPQKLSKNLPTWVSKLRGRLKCLAGIKQDPIAWKDGCYQCQFKVALMTASEQQQIDENEIEQVFREESTCFTKHRRGVRDRDNEPDDENS
jgi:hypothetical protein